MSAPSLLAVAPGSASTYAFVPNLPQEVKSCDITVSTLAPLGWQYLISDTFADISNGFAGDQRVGRSIRVVGIVFRASVLSCFQFPDEAITPLPYTIDFMWNHRSTIQPPDITEIYLRPGDQYYKSLPNPALPLLKFIKRVQREPKQNFTTVNVNIACNKVITWASFPTFAPDTELYITCANQYSSAPDPSSFPLSIVSRLRVLYVDA